MLPLIAAGIALGTVIASVRRAGASVSVNVDDGIVDVDRGHARPDVEPGPASSRIDVRALAASAGAPQIYQDFFAMTAYGESKAKTTVGLGIRTGAPPYVKINDSLNESRASVVAYDRNLSWLAPCWARELYTFGSGGLFAMMPASAIAAFKNSASYRCVHPWSIFDPTPTMIYAAWMARRLQGWSNWDGTVIGMRAGWASPSSMHNVSAEKRKKWGDHCQAVGLPPSFLDKQLPRWRPAPAAELWISMGADDGWLPRQENAA